MRSTKTRLVYSDLPILRNLSRLYDEHKIEYGCAPRVIYMEKKDFKEFAKIVDYAHPINPSKVYAYKGIKVKQILNERQKNKTTP